MHWLDLPLRTLSHTLSRLLSLDPAGEERLTALDGRWIAVHVSAPEFSLHLRIEQARLQISAGAIDDPERTPDAVVSGRASALLALARDPESGGQDVRFSGDLGVVRDLRSLVADTDVDWEAPLARMLGELPAHRIGEGGRALLRWVDQSRRHCEASLGDYLTEEQRLLPPQLEVADFLADVDRLRADADRLDARLRLLERGRAR